MFYDYIDAHSEESHYLIEMIYINLALGDFLFKLQNAVLPIDLPSFLVKSNYLVYLDLPRSPWNLVTENLLWDLLDHDDTISMEEKEHFTCSKDDYPLVFALTYHERTFAVFSDRGMLLLDIAADVEDNAAPNTDRFISYWDIREIKEDKTDLLLRIGRMQRYVKLNRTKNNSNILSCIANFLSSLKILANIPRILTTQSIFAWHFDDIRNSLWERHQYSYLRGRTPEIPLTDEIMTNAISAYAGMIAEDEIMGFIDDTFFQNGEYCILFGQQGIAFPTTFSYEYLLYEEIADIFVSPNHKKITFLGSFSTREGKQGNPSLKISSYKISPHGVEALKRCIEDIKANERRTDDLASYMDNESALIDLHTVRTEIDLFKLNTTLNMSLCGSRTTNPAIWSWSVLQWDDLRDLLNKDTVISEVAKAQLSYSDERQALVFALQFLNSIFAVFTVNGILFLVDDDAHKDEGNSQNPYECFIPYDAIHGIGETKNELIIRYGFPWRCLVIDRTEENDYVLSCISHFLCSEKRQEGTTVIQLVRSVLSEHIDHICIGQHHRHGYLCGRDSKALYETKLANALKTYASKVDLEDVAGFIDDSRFGNGKSGILFGEHGLAFTSGVGCEYLKYAEIDDVIVSPNGNKLSFLGSFSSRGRFRGYPCLVKGSYDMKTLERCLIEIVNTTCYTKRNELLQNKQFRL